MRTLVRKFRERFARTKPPQTIAEFGVTVENMHKCPHWNLIRIRSEPVRIDRYVCKDCTRSAAVAHVEIEHSMLTPEQIARIRMSIQ